MPQSTGDLAGGSYEERQRLTRGDLLLVPAGVLFTGVGVLMLRDGDLWGWVVTPFFGLFLLLRLTGLVSRRVMLRVDRTGIALGTHPPWPQRTAVVPWSHLDAVVLWRQRSGYASMRYIGLERRDGSPPLPGSAHGTLLRRLIRYFTPGDVGNQTAVDSRAVAGWSVNRDRLAAVIGRFAPHVRVDDQW